MASELDDISTAAAQLTDEPASEAQVENPEPEDAAALEAEAAADREAELEEERIRREKRSKKKKKPRPEPEDGEGPRQPTADPGDELVPIRLSMMVDSHRIQDAFTGRLGEAELTPEAYARSMCEDLDLPERLEYFIAQSIRRQLSEYTAMRAMRQPANGPENIFMIRLDMSINGVGLYDQFEWDIDNPLNSPELFAKSMSTDLGLSREFEACIAHSIREQIVQYQKALREGTKETLEYFRRPKPIKAAIRSERELALWTPVVSRTPTPSERRELKKYEAAGPAKSVYEQAKLLNSRPKTDRSRTRERKPVAI
eukprot:TRINITY_DN10131_c1_g1_i1.p2 TRINITY_DN10131_c1_g1~~TRINITY_DN10131_c1_g1_i1.p2  ORF type:complete len:313 (+),score=71.31 TRINITY_DN10131_c1_g1_i1:1149-2087(+)